MELAEHLQRSESELEEAVGQKLLWAGEGNKNIRSICVMRSSSYLHEDDWPQQHEWLMERLGRLHSAFYGRIALGSP